jgi:hypothetical protein
MNTSIKFANTYLEFQDIPLLFVIVPNYRLIIRDSFQDIPLLFVIVSRTFVKDSSQDILATLKHWRPNTRDDYQT